MAEIIAFAAALFVALFALLILMHNVRLDLVAGRATFSTIARERLVLIVVLGLVIAHLVTS